MDYLFPSLAKFLSHCPGDGSRTVAHFSQSGTLILWTECWVGAVALDLLGLTLLELSLSPSSKLGWQKASGASGFWVWWRVSTLQVEAGYTCLEFSLCSMKLEGNEKCWQLPLSGRCWSPWWKHREERTTPYWPHPAKGIASVTLTWAGKSRPQLKCHKLLQLLLWFSRFSWINISSFAVCL